MAQRSAGNSPERPHGASARVGLALAGALALSAPPVEAEVLTLPIAPADLLERVAADCADCVAAGFLPCGVADVQYGRRFAATALQGTPPRAYLLANAPVSKELVPLLGGPDASSTAAALAGRFAGTRLIIVEGDWAHARALAPEGPPRVAVDPAQQACFRDPGRGLGCCLGDGPRDRGCLPKADPPSVRLDFRDPADDERLSLRVPVGKGEATLRRSGAGGRQLYWCHKWTRARLVGPE